MLMDAKEVCSSNNLIQKLCLSHQRRHINNMLYPRSGTEVFDQIRGVQVLERLPIGITSGARTTHGRQPLHMRILRGTTR
jgi:hypothetical protein